MTSRSHKYTALPGRNPYEVYGVRLRPGVYGPFCKRVGRLFVMSVCAISLPAMADISGHTAPVPPIVPIHFEPNVGQGPAGADYVARGGGYRIALTRRGLVVTLRGQQRTNVRGSQAGEGFVEVCLQIKLLHSRVDGTLQPEARLRGVSNYFVGNDTTRWYRNVPNYGKVRYTAVYPGVDWVLYGNPDQLEYDFVIAPNADPRRIRLTFDGATHISVDRNGGLLVDVGPQTLHQLKPAVYQTTPAGQRVLVPARYILHGNRLSFKLGSYDRTRSLVIDPALAYSTFLGGTGGSRANAIAVDSAGSTYVAGETDSTDFPTFSAFQNENRTDNAFITKFSPNGRELIYSTYLGGSVGEEAKAIVVDKVGNAYIAGYTFSSNFPTVNAFQNTNRAAAGLASSTDAASQAFVTKLNATGDSLIYSTYLGGSGSPHGTGSLDAASSIAVDGDGNAYVTGITDSSDFPVMNALQATLHGRGNIFISKLSSTGNKLIFSTYLGGSAFDSALGLAIDVATNVYVVGYSNSSDFPLAAPFQSVNRANANGTGFVSKLNAAGNKLVYSSFLGGSGFDQASAITLDSMGDAVVVGGTGSADFPTVNAFQDATKVNVAKGGYTAFVTKINAAGSALLYSTYLGGSFADEALSVAVNSAGEVFLAGETYSTDFPTVNAIQNENKAAALMARNAFVTQLNADGSALTFSTYLGGSGSFGPTASHTTIPFDDYATGIALDMAGGIYIAGITGSVNFPTVNAFQPTNKSATSYGASPTAFVTKFGAEATDPITVPTSNGGAAGGGGEADWAFIMFLLATLAARKTSFIWRR